MEEQFNPNPNEQAPPPAPIKRKRRSPLRDSAVLNFGLKFALGAVVVLVFLTAVQCSLKKPESPQWTTQMAVPMVNRTYPMNDIIDRIGQPNIYYDSTGAQDQVLFRYEENADTISVTDNLTTEDISHIGGDGLGAITIDPADPNPITISLGDYVTLVLGVGIPAASFDIVEDIDPIGSFSMATISSGGFDFAFTNDFGVDLDTVIFKLYDITLNDTVVVDSLPDPGLASGDIDTMYIDLSGKTISDDLRMIIHCHTPGAGPSFTLADKNLETDVSSDSLVVTSAVTQVPALSRTFQEIVDMSDSNTIISAELSSGSVAIQIQNTTELNADFNITLNDFTNGGSPLVIARTVAANSTSNVNIDLSGYIFQPVDTIAPQTLAIDVTADIDSTAPSLVTISENDSLLINASISNIAFSSMTGIIQPTNVDFDPVVMDVEVPQGFDSLQLVGAVLNLYIENGVNFPGTLNLTVSGNNGESVVLSGAVAAGNASSPVTSTIQSGSLDDFLNPMPSQITVSGLGVFGDGSTAGTVTADDFVFSHVEITSPLSVIIADSTSVESDISHEEIDQEDIDLITDHVVEARFNTVITNHLPLGVSVTIFLDGDSTHLNANQAQLVVGPLSVAAGQVDGSGFVTAATESENLLSLDSLEIKILENDTLYIGQSIILQGTDGQAVTVSADDYYQVLGAIELEYLFDGEF